MYYSLSGDGWDDMDRERSGMIRAVAYEGDVSVAIGAGDDDLYHECPDCGAYIEDDAEQTETWDDDHEEGDEPYVRVDGHTDECAEPEWRPPQHIGRRFNGAGVDVDVDENRVRLWLSIGDPRGAFCFDLDEMSDGRLRLSMPAPSDGLAHMTLRPLGSDGNYVVAGSYGESLPDLYRAATAARDELAALIQRVEERGAPTTETDAALRAWRDLGAALGPRYGSPRLAAEAAVSDTPA